MYIRWGRLYFFGVRRSFCLCTRFYSLLLILRFDLRSETNLKCFFGFEFGFCLTSYFCLKPGKLVNYAGRGGQRLEFWSRNGVHVMCHTTLRCGKHLKTDFILGTFERSQERLSYNQTTPRDRMKQRNESASRQHELNYLVTHRSQYNKKPENVSGTVVPVKGGDLRTEVGVIGDM